MEFGSSIEFTLDDSSTTNAKHDQCKSILSHHQFQIVSFIRCPVTDHIDYDADNITHKPMKAAVLWDVTSCRLVEVYLVTEDIADGSHRTLDNLVPARLHHMTSQKTAILIAIAVRTSNVTNNNVCHSSSHLL